MYLEANSRELEGSFSHCQAVALIPFQVASAGGAPSCFIDMLQEVCSSLWSQLDHALAVGSNPALLLHEKDLKPYNYSAQG